MISLRSMSIAARLAGGFLIMAIVVLLLGVLSLRETAHIHDQTVEIEERWIPNLREISSINQDFMRYRIFALRSLLSTNAQDIRQQRQIMETLSQDLTAAEERLDHVVESPNNQRIFDDFRAQRLRYMAVADEMALEMDAGNHQVALQILDRQLNPIADTATSHLIQLEELVVTAADAAARQAEQSYQSAIR